MNTKESDRLKNYFKELPQEKVSAEFSNKVMVEVMTHWGQSPVKFQPLISKKEWWKITFLGFVITGILMGLHSFAVESTAVSTSHPLFGIDILRFVKSFSGYIGKINDLSPVIVTGIFAVIALWFFDQLLTKAIRR